MRLSNQGSFAILTLALLASPSYAAKRRAPLPVAENPLDLAKPTWVAQTVARGADQPAASMGVRIGSVYPAPATDKHPQPAEAIALINASDEPVRLSGLRLEVVRFKRGKKKTSTMTLS